MVSPIRSQAPVRSPAPQASAPARPAMLEGDASFRMAKDGTLLANGTFKADHGFMLRLVQHVLRNPKRFSGMQVRFDQATGTYAATGKIKIGPLWFPVTGRARPTVDQNQPAFHFEQLTARICGMNISAKWLHKLAINEIVKALNKDGGNATGDAKTDMVRLPTAGIMNLVDGIPGFIRLNDRENRYGMQVSKTGDLTLTMAAANPGPAIAPGPTSDFAMTADAAALTAFLTHTLGPDMVIQRATPRAGGLTIDAQVEYKPVSDLVTAGRDLIAVLASRGRPISSPPEAHEFGPLSLDAKFDGTKVVLVPSLKAARKELADKLTAAGIAVQTLPDGLHFDIAPWLATKGIQVAGLKLDASGLSTRLSLDIDGRIHNKALLP